MSAEPPVAALPEPVAAVPSWHAEPLTPRQWVVVVALAAMADVTIWRGHGFAGLAALFTAAVLLSALATFRPHRALEPLALGLLLALLSAKLVWCGSALQVAVGFWLLMMYAMTLSGMRPYVVGAWLFGVQTFIAGPLAWIGHFIAPRGGLLTENAGQRAKLAWGGFVRLALPAAAFLAFGTLFVLANPDLASAFGTNLEWISRTVREWYLEHGPDTREVVFCLVAAGLASGALRPLLNEAMLLAVTEGWSADERVAATEAPAPMYAAFRNMLVALIALFAVYLVFEFATLWFHEFPDGFYYSGYCHLGAFWLTAALALATATLSWIFRARILRDPRRAKLNRLAWIWSAENFLLAVTVYHRMLIYVGFNGMTRMRIVGFLGITAVVLGLVLVLWKIAKTKDFAWLVHRQLWALALMVYLYALLPVDTLVMRYNVARILAGDPAPSVQITEHPIDAQGILELPPLLDCDNPTIRDGIRAMLASRYREAQDDAKKRAAGGWTAFQGAERLMLQRLDDATEQLDEYANIVKRERAYRNFKDYAYQWF